VDALEKSLSAVSLKIRTMRNALVPVNRLPVEVLQQIPSWLPYTFQIFSASHVCRYWRASLLSYSELWSSLNCRSVGATRALIERSGVAPLDIVISPGYSPDAFCYTIPHVRRWGSLQVRALRNEIGPVLTALTGPGSAPKLRDLTIIPMIGYDSEGGTITLKGKILGGVLPSLQRIYLCSLKINFQKLTAPNLTHLFLASTRPEFIDMTALLGFLERSPLIEDLELRYPGPTLPDLAHLDHFIPLHRLSRIALWDRGAMYLHHLTLPRGVECELNFLFTDLSATAGFIEEMFGMLPERLHQIYEAESMSIVPDYHRGAVRFLGPSGNVEIIPTFFHGERTPITRFIVYPPSVLKNVKELFVCSRDGTIPGWGSADVRKHLKQMTSLKSLTVMQCNATSFIRALLPTGDKVPCPTLKNLTIHLAHSETSCVPDFRSMVERRGSHGHKFEKMVLIFDYKIPESLDIPNLEVKADYRPLYWDSKKKVWRYLNEGEGYMESRGSRTLSPPGILPLDHGMFSALLPGMIQDMDIHF
jgi:hypothetical protein